MDTAQTKSDASSNRLTSPLTVLTKAFLLWKLLLVVVVAFNSGPGYDTSADLLYELQSSRDPVSVSRAFPARSWSSGLLLKFVRWDAIYYVSAAKAGYVHEQEWAFGWGLTTLVGWITRHAPGVVPSELGEALSAVFVSNTSHFISVILLFYLCNDYLFDKGSERRAVTVAALHIIAPGGVFLSAPSGESLFAALSFAGYYIFARSMKLARLTSHHGYESGLCTALAGTIFGISCLVRSNGIFNGILFAVELVRTVFFEPRPRQLLQNAPRIVGLGTGGMLVGLGFAFPQYLAWQQFCTVEDGHEQRSWCQATPPSIYTFVQEHYLDVGFMRYWRLNFLPLWIIAAPMLAVLFTSSVSRLLHAPKETLLMKNSVATTGQTVLSMMALPQLVLTTLAVSTFHVQIVNRLASGYPLMYIWLESLLHGDVHWRALGKYRNSSRIVVSWMVMYALIQACLYAQFLPPA